MDKFFYVMPSKIYVDQSKVNNISTENMAHLLINAWHIKQKAKN